MICTLENAVRKLPQFKIKRDIDRENRFMEKVRSYIEEHARGFDSTMIEKDEYDKIIRWIAQYKLFLNYQRREEEGIEYEEICEISKKKRKAWRKPTAEENPPCSPPKKGLLLVGKTGRGKTTAARIVGGFFNMPFASLDEIDVAWSRNPTKCEAEYAPYFLKASPVVIDDVGAETGQKRYGNESIVTSLLHRWYDDWRFNGKQIIMTSNLSTWDGALGNQATFLGKYGERIHSRILEMFEIVRINGSVDLRKEIFREVSG